MENDSINHVSQNQSLVKLTEPSTIDIETQPLDSIQALDSAIYAINANPEKRFGENDRVLQPDESKLSMEKGNVNLGELAQEDVIESAPKSNEQIITDKKQSVNLITVSSVMHYPRIELGAQRWQRWILPINHWHLFIP